MLNLFWLTCLTIFLNTYSQTAQLINLSIFNDSPQFDSLGYGNCCSTQNGEFNLIKHAIKDGDIVFDLGAHVGEWSNLVLQVHPNVSIHAFEPIPQSFKQLQVNLNRPNVLLNNLAAHNERCYKKFIIYASPTGVTDCSSLYNRPVIAHAKKETIIVETVDLDSFCEKHSIKKIDFLKIDTEGNELNILLGSRQLLENKAIKSIQFEYGGTYPDANITLKEVYELLTGFGYSIYRILPQGLLKINKWRDELENAQYSNYFAVLSEK